MRLQIYYLDMGAYRKAYIGDFSDEQLAELLTVSCFVAVKLTENDPYGKTLPDTMKEFDFRRAEDGTAIIEKAAPGAGNTEGGKEK